jgi:hypothetical protein
MAESAQSSLNIAGDVEGMSSFATGKRLWIKPISATRIQLKSAIDRLSSSKFHIHLVACSSKLHVSLISSLSELNFFSLTAENRAADGSRRVVGSVQFGLQSRGTS